MQVNRWHLLGVPKMWKATLMSIEQEVARRACHRLFKAVEGGSLTVIEGDHFHRYGSGDLQAHLQIADRRAYPAFLRGSRGLALSYAAGFWESEDLPTLIRLGARNVGRFDRLRRYAAPLREPYQALLTLLSPHSKRAAARAVGAHYDLPPDLFAAMLDPTMSYSCLYFPAADASLEEAALAKLELVCRRLELSASDQVLEIGAGWGAFALYAASRFGCRVTAVTLSPTQAEWIKRRVAEERLDQLVKVVVADYRDLAGRYDKVCSIEMVEAVGHRGLGRFFAQCSSLLKPGGLMLLQAIVIDDRAWRIERISRSFIKTLIFPLGSLPSQAKIAQQLARRSDLQTVCVRDLTAHYVKTLSAWRQRFLAAWQGLRKRGFDDRFKRLWELYLAWCEAGFAERRIEDKQYLLAKPQWRPAPPVLRRKEGLFLARPD